MARTLSPAEWFSTTLIASAMLAFTCATTNAEPQFQSPAVKNPSKSSITIRPAAEPTPPPRQTQPNQQQRQTTAQPQVQPDKQQIRQVATLQSSSGRPATFRNPFSAEAALESSSPALLPGPLSRWRSQPTQPHEFQPALSPPSTQFAAPRNAGSAMPSHSPSASELRLSPLAQPTHITPQPARSTVQIVQPSSNTAAAQDPSELSTARVKHGPLHVSGIEPMPTAAGEGVAPTTMPVRQAIITFDTPENANAAAANPPVLTSGTEALAGTANIAGPASEPNTVLELPDPTHFTSQPTQPVWMTAGNIPPEAPTAVDQMAFEAGFADSLAITGPEIIQPDNLPVGIVSSPALEQLPQDSADSTAEAESDDPVIASDFEDSPAGWFAQASDIIHHDSTVDGLSKAIELCHYIVNGHRSQELDAAARRLASQAHNRRGELYADEGRMEEALNEFESAVSNDDKNALALHNRAVTFAQQANYEAALADFNRVIKLNPGLAIAYRNRAELLALRGEQAAAVKDYTRALEFESGDPELYAARAHALQHMGKFAEALADIEQAVQHAPQNVDLLTQRGNLFADQGDFDRAMADFQRAVRIDAKSAAAHRGIAWLKATCPVDRHRDAFEALSAARTAMELSPADDYLALEAMAAAHANAGEFNKAVDAEQQALHLAPAEVNKTLQARLALYQQGKPFRTANRKTAK